MLLNGREEKQNQQNQAMGVKAFIDQTNSHGQDWCPHSGEIQFS